ncbi:MAG: single-stranded DNA-binding protein [Candidatus Colwellbacteria bacterium CG_4_9_14_0_2_um_filter_50_12]|uniref:Single-stranded DNA-binding protein n=1 Tax=Candidatus Colwellbacteria bacterium CG_4_9_14_0_2_um_filter_50_12 TaxID=1974538 RepID=A0A2M8G1M2_9BACT|nr:MAG: single-stranded DNA-binding protein [Candidatus Colwellbacteria bacterium CG_4_9_14_0_2_um_filter_50_12]
MNLNKVFIIGRLTADPQSRTTPGGAQVTTFSVATNRSWTDKNGSKKESTEFHNVVIWGRQAEIAAEFLTRGSTVLIEGRLQTRSWEGKDGQLRKTTEIVTERMQLGPRPGGAPRGDVGSKGSKDAPRKEGTDAPAAEKMPVIEIGDEEVKPEDLPF